MEKIKIKVLDFDRFQTAFFLLFFAISAFVPTVIHSQFVTGPLVNAILFLSVIFCGTRVGLLLSFVPSVFALFSGILPIFLAPLVPFIVISNAIMVGFFATFRHRGFWIATIFAAILKFLFLFASAQILSRFFDEMWAKKALIMFSWPQLVTAIIGAFVAFSILKLVQKYAKTS
jgi:hypothetical protein